MRFSPSAPEPVTLLVTRKIRPERYADFLAWMHSGEVLASHYPGYLGSGVLSPPPGGDQYEMVYRFADEASLAAWAGSEQRQAWLQHGAGLVQVSRIRRARGLDNWFGPAQQRPPRWKQAVTIWLGYFPVSLAFAFFLADPLSVLPLFWRVLVSTLLLTPVMVFGLIPLVSKMLGSWLNPQQPAGE